MEPAEMVKNILAILCILGIWLFGLWQVKESVVSEADAYIIGSISTATSLLLFYVAFVYL